MNWERAKELPIGHLWDNRDLKEHFQAVWGGDRQNQAAYTFIREMHDELESPKASATTGRVDLYPTRILDMKPPYQYILPTLKRLPTEDKRQLYLKDSKVKEYLAQIEKAESATLEFGAYPAIEALAFVVMGLRDHAESELSRPARDHHHESINPMDYVSPKKEVH